MGRFAFTILVSVLVHSAAAPADADRYWALMRDGEFRQGERLRRLQGADRLAELDDKPLLDVEHPVRTIRDTQHTPFTPESFVEMTNGDILIGHIVEAVVYLTNMSKKSEMDAVWCDWIGPPANWPQRACVQAALAPGTLVEITVIAARG